MWSPSFRRALIYLPLLLIGAEAVLHLLQVVFTRIQSPYELEWMEGAMLQQVHRLLHGLPLYGEPTLDFVPALYMPLYYGVSALSAYVFGESLFALRLVSITAALITHILVFLIVRRVSGSLLAALLGALLFAATFPHTAFWFDVARVDSLWVLCLAATVYALLSLREQASIRAVIVVAVFSVAALLAKQASLFFMPFLVLSIWCWAGWRYALGFCVLFALGASFFIALIIAFYDERFFFYVFQMAGSHGVTLSGFRRFGLDVMFSIAGTLFSALLYPFLLDGSWREKLGWLAVLAGFIFLSMVSRAYAGAFFNVLMPLHFCVAIFSALTLALLLKRTQVSSWWFLPALLLMALLLNDMYRARYVVAKQLPTADSDAAYGVLIDRIAAVQGRVCITSHGYLAWMAGKDFCAHNTQVTDVITGSDPALAQALRDDARQKILSGYYSVMVLDREKELLDLGLQFSEIPYTVTPIDYVHGPIQFPVNGYSPKLWLEFKEEKKYAR